MVKSEKKVVQKCQICGKEKPLELVMPGEFVRPSITELIRVEHPDWTPDGYICLDDLNHYRSEYIEDLIETEKGELSEIDKEVLDSIRENEILSRNTNVEISRKYTVGDRISDKVASFGGSWKFIITFGVVLLVWITINSMVLIMKPYDPYPYILLNLILSMLAAIQAPVIMMSQNRQETKDRIRAENDYRINLKAELEIHHLGDKIEYLLTKQWHRLLEIQQIQIELMEEIVNKDKKKT
jgi:uncharacterized membrane protein